MQVSAIELAHIAERSRKCQKKIALLRRVLYTHFFTPKNPSALHKLRYLIEHKHFTAEGFAAQTLQQPFSDPSPTIHRHKGNMNELAVGADFLCFARYNFHCLPDIFHYLRRESLLQTY